MTNINTREELIKAIENRINSTKENYKKVSGREMDIINKCCVVLSREHSDLINDLIKWDNDNMTVGMYTNNGKNVITVTVFESFSNNNLSPSISMEIYKKIKR